MRIAEDAAIRSDLTRSALALHHRHHIKGWYMRHLRVKVCEIRESDASKILESVSMIGAKHVISLHHVGL